MFTKNPQDAVIAAADAKTCRTLSCVKRGRRRRRGGRASFGAAATTEIALLVCLFAQGPGTSALATAALAAVADLGTPETRMRDMAAYQGADRMGYAYAGGLLAAAAVLAVATAVFAFSKRVAAPS
jgi:hypothetical protein